MNMIIFEVGTCINNSFFLFSLKVDWIDKEDKFYSWGPGCQHYTSVISLYFC